MFAINPSPSLATEAAKWAWWEGGFTDAELIELARVGDTVGFDKETEGDHYVEDTEPPYERPCHSSWIKYNRENHWIYERFEKLTGLVNGRWFQYDLSCFAEWFRYRVYHTEPNPVLMDYHTDTGQYINQHPPRKLTIVLQVNDPSEYDGGVLQLMNGRHPFNCPRKKGFLLVFPTWMPHRVTPITRGDRKALIALAHGPQFR